MSGTVAITNLIEDFNKLGVEYSSGRGDYAEWLERVDPMERLTAGDIVGVKGGKVSKSTTDSEQLMVISHKPIVLGNVPEKELLHLGNNVAFMGQVPVKVMGPVSIGDYIVAHEEIKGYGRAISPAKMSVDNFRNSVGRDWNENSSEGPKLINTVVGVHNGDWISIFKKIKSYIFKHLLRPIFIKLL